MTIERMTTSEQQHAGVRRFENLDAFKAAVGTELGTSEWLTVTQEQVNMFADATGDRQWIHVDQQRAAAGPFGGTIAHGYLTLSLVPTLAESIYTIDGLAMGVNYGADKLRFPHPVAVGSRIRETATLTAISDRGTGTEAHVKFVVEIDGISKPACVVDVIYVLAAA
ncbi:acyl dehydratase [Williamsia limnetica]|uniref:Acyl dehydratase n=1 Tax=Williamsia limnetica TaxID=882452 RepID=A0A318RGR2_WILLI|nr:acyl dehydratase [Williamsia limnetica]